MYCKILIITLRGCLCSSSGNFTFSCFACEFDVFEKLEEKKTSSPVANAFILIISQAQCIGLVHFHINCYIFFLNLVEQMMLR